MTNLEPRNLAIREAQVQTLTGKIKEEIRKRALEAARKKQK